MAQTVGVSQTSSQQEVVHVQNSAEPEYTTPTISMTKVWEVGGEDPGFIFNNIEDIDVGPAGRIYVLDVLETDVKVFSPDGQYLFNSGRKDKGPGSSRDRMGFRYYLSQIKSLSSINFG